MTCRHNTPECFYSSRNNEELLEGKLVTSMLSSVDNIEAGYWKDIGGGVAGNIGIVLPKGNTTGYCSCLTGSKRNCIIIIIIICV